MSPRRGCREGHQLDDFLDKNHILHRLILFDGDEGRELCQRLNIIKSRDLPALIQSKRSSLAPAFSPGSGARRGVSDAFARQTKAKRKSFATSPSSAPGRRGLAAAVYAASGRAENRRAGGLRARRPGRFLLVDREFLRLSDRHQRRRPHESRPASGLPVSVQRFQRPSQALSLSFAEGEHPSELQIEGCPATLRAKCVLISTGAEYNRIEAEGREGLRGPRRLLRGHRHGKQIVPRRNR